MNPIFIEPFPTGDVKDMEEQRKTPVPYYRSGDGEDIIRDAQDEGGTVCVVAGEFCGWKTDRMAVKECWACRLVHGRTLADGLLEVRKTI
jgi:hypothetical protein